MKRQKIRALIYARICKRLKVKQAPCVVCGKPVPKKKATLEHIKPVSAGGGWDPGNLAISHQPCNVWRGVRPLSQVRVENGLPPHWGKKGGKDGIEGAGL